MAASMITTRRTRSHCAAAVLGDVPAVKLADSRKRYAARRFVAARFPDRVACELSRLFA